MNSRLSRTINHIRPDRRQKEFLKQEDTVVTNSTLKSDMLSAQPKMLTAFSVCAYVLHHIQTSLSYSTVSTVLDSICVELHRMTKVYDRYDPEVHLEILSLSHVFDFTT